MKLRWLLISLCLSAFSALLPNNLIARAEPNMAITYHVTSTADVNPPWVCTARADGGSDCPSLRAAIIAANSNPGWDTILLQHNTTYQLTILSSGPDDATKGDLDISADVAFGYTAICFAGTCGATIQGAAGFNDRLLDVQVAAQVSLVNVTFRNGLNTTHQGGAIMNSGVLTLTGSLVISNVAQSGGGIFNFDSGVLNLIDTRVTSNTARISNGGGLRNDGTVYLTDSQFDLNYADEQGGGIANGGPLIISGGLISGNIANDGNVAMYSGGGIFSRDPGWLVMTQTQVLSNVGVRGGGGLVNQYAVAHLTDVTLAGNTVTNGSGGGIESYGDLTLERVTILTNTATFGGGVAVLNGAVTATQATVSGNSATSWGGGWDINSTVVARINTSQIMSNTSTTEGGGIRNTGWLALNGSTLYRNRGGDGGGLYNTGTVLLGNATVSGNYANDGGGGIFNTGAASVAVLNSLTIANNRADYNNNDVGQGGGLRVVTGTVYVYNTLIAQNIDSNPAPHFDCSGLITGSHNLIQSLTGCVFSGATTGNVTGQLPQIGLLQANGGATWTHALALSSPARNAGNSGGGGFTGCPSVDQRGVFRGARCDIGAVEVAQVFVPVVVK